MILNPNKVEILDLSAFLGDLLDYLGIIAFLAWIVALWVVFG